MNVLLINPPSLCVSDDRLEPPLGLLYIAAVLLKDSACNVRVYDMSGCHNPDEIDDAIEHIPLASVYGIYCLCTAHDYIRKTCKHIKKRWADAYVVLGGPNATALPNWLLEDTGADTVVVGEGEDAFRGCIESYKAQTPVSGVIIGTPRNDIDSFPFPARHLVDKTSYSRRMHGKPVASVISSRGCPHHCIHCNSVIMGGGSKRVRYRSPGNVTKELQLLRKDFSRIRFNDDCFSSNPKLDELLKQITELDIQFRIFAQLSDFKDGLAVKLAKAGCMHVSVGLETLNPENLNAIGKGRQIGKEHAVRSMREAGITVRAFFMVGLPFDTDASIEKYFKKAAGLGFEEFSIYPLIPYPGTPIANNPERFGYRIRNRNFEEYVQIGIDAGACYALDHENFSTEDVRRWKYRAEEILLQGGAIYSNQSKVAN